MGLYVDFGVEGERICVIHESGLDFFLSLMSFPFVNLLGFGEDIFSLDLDFSYPVSLSI